MEDTEMMHGGGSNQVRLGDGTIIRNTGKWSPFVHKLLQFLTENGF